MRGGEQVLSGVVFRISAGFLVVALVLLATALSLSEYYLEEERRLAAAGDVEGAIEASQTAIRLDPFDTDALEEHSVLLQQQRRHEEAAEACRRAFEDAMREVETALATGAGNEYVVFFA